MVGMIVKAKIGELEEDAMVRFTRMMRKELTGVVQGVSGKKRILVRFQDGCETDMASNQLTIMIVENSPAEEKPEVPKIPDITEEQVN